MLGFLLLLACVSRPHPVVVLVSWDTTRADALSCYGGAGAATPVADLLAGDGLRFEWALSQAPTTLSSHTALMSGLDSHGHGVVRNGFPVSQQLPLLAERFQDAGWDTIGVVGSTVLESAMGLDRGFRVYDDEIMLGGASHFETTADIVTRRALSQVDGRDRKGPLFLFVHYFDAHMLWDSAPDEVRARFVDPGYQGPASGTLQGLERLTAAHKNGTLRSQDANHARSLYLAEVAWMDSQLGVLLAGLEDRGLMEDSLVVLFGDHGEILEDGDSYPYSHGADVDLGATHVPLLMSGRGRFELPRGRLVERQVRLMDLGATILGHVGHVNRHGEGEDLAVTWKGVA
ncbi:MAG: sulfatase, partial [Myxococcota bacterium]|nr:sulfatase [Myxococcota bacterium]